MSTTMFFRSDAADIDPTFPEQERAFRDTNSASSQTSVTASQDGPLGSPIVATVGQLDNRKYFWFSRQLQAVTISSNITYTINVRENNASADAMVQIELWRTDYKGTLISLISSSNPGTELITGITGTTTWIATPTSTTLNNGDRILAIVEYVDAPATEMLSGFQLQFRFGNSPAAFVSQAAFTDTLTELATPIGQTHTLPQQGVGA